MAKLPEIELKTTAALILRGYEEAHKEEHRPHLGASLIGHSCDRYLWLTLHWAGREKLSGQKLRLFQTGHLAEPRFTEDLRRIGVEVHDTQPDGTQWRVSTHGGHFAGSMDGVGLKIPEAPKTWHVLEYKTHSEKSFRKLEKEGVLKAKPQHHAQMQVYMGETGMDRALYLAVNKNTDELYSERVKFDRAEYERLKERALRIIQATVPPSRISNDASRYECGYCKFKDQCHGDQVPEVNCRTCARSTPVLTGNGAWTCDFGQSPCEIPDEVQRTGCDEHRFIPIFLERTAKAVAYEAGAVVYETPDGRRFANGDGTQGTFTSQEIRDCGGKATLPDMVEVKLAVRTARVVPSEPFNLEQAARALYDANDNKVKPTWDRLGDTTKDVWRERVMAARGEAVAA